MCLPGASRVTGREEDEVVELGAAQAVRLVVLHEEQVVAGRGANVLAFSLGIGVGGSGSGGVG
jgi:hypothetical protein